MSSQPLLQTPPGKRIALPTRIEPKVFFANERTFLSWLNFTAILGGLAIGLLNFGDRVGQISAGLFTLVAMAAMLYALYTFHWRARSIRRSRNQNDQRGGFDDRFGPTVLALALLSAVVVNFVLRVVVEGQGQGQGQQGQGQQGQGKQGQGQQGQGNAKTGEMNPWASSAGIGSGSIGAGAEAGAGAGADTTDEVGLGLDGLAAIEELGFELK